MRLGLLGTGRIGTLHATTLRGLDEVDRIVVADADAPRARALAATLPDGTATAVDTVDDLYAAGVDGVVIAAATSAHAELIHQAIDHRVPVFCEKPVAPDIPGTREVVSHTENTGVPLQIGFQRRFDAGYTAARVAVGDGRLGWLHTVRAVTADAEPPPPAFLPASGGLFRDCGIHDFDIVRWLTGDEVVSVSAAGANQGADFFTASGDVDTCAALLEFGSGLLGTVSATRYNGAGHDVRLEVCGSRGALFVGNDDRAPLPSAESGVDWPSASPYRTFVERFHDAYIAELAAFVDVAAGREESPATAAEALEALYIAEACELSRLDRRRVDVSEVKR